MILLYHHVAPLDRVPKNGAGDHSEGWHFNHSPEAFEFQLSELQQRGYHFVSLSQLIHEIRATGSEPEGSVVITFDDGWIDNYTYAFPVLKKLKIPATFFVVTNFLRQNTPSSTRMNLEQLHELSAHGMTIGSHTKTHPDLTVISSDEAAQEIAGSKDDLQNALERPVDFLAYPGGGFNSRVADLAREAGYRAACSVLGPKTNDQSSLYWLYRDLLTPGLDSLGDRYRLSRIARKAFAFRVNRRLKQRLQNTPHSRPAAK
ncbi:MAG TPA: polysaccharide deacetylase family protein [Verrucomicrobiae bacterium]|jgi:peptidoglycan/xylan/chitin deacetylase (PgdA/CDA1 family)